MENKKTWYEAYFKYDLDGDFVGPIDFEPHIGLTKVKFPDLDSLRTAVEGCWKSCRALEVKFVKCECTRDAVLELVNPKEIARAKFVKEVRDEAWKVLGKVEESLD